jgi:hypothetical protein
LLHYKWSFGKKPRAAREKGENSAFSGVISLEKGQKFW